MSHFCRLRLRQFRKADEGQTLVLFALGMMMLLLFAAYGIDVGWLHYQKYQMQKAADAAALAGAEALSYGSNYSQAAQYDAGINGFQNGQNGVTVTVNNPPQTAGDPFVGQNNYVEVIVQQNRPTFFMKILGNNWASVNVQSRAVASIVGNGSGCMYALDPNDDAGALNISGNFAVTSSCGVYVNSTSASALTNSGTMNAGAEGIGVVGPSMNEGWTGSSYTPTPVNIPSFTDPLARLAAPVPTGPCLPGGQVNGGPPTTLISGTYCGGISITNHANVTLSGMYILCGGGMTVDSTSTVSGSAVTFYNTGKVAGVCAATYAPVSLNGGGSLSAPGSGTYAGILFFQDRNYVSTLSTDASTINGSTPASYTGALYFPGTNLTYSGTPSSVTPSLLIAWQITIAGQTSLSNQLLGAGRSPIHTAVIAE